jgi:hypothetical protein
MIYQAHSNSGISSRRKRCCVATLAFALLLGAGAIMGSLPARAGDGNAENDAGEGNFDHSGIYSTLLASHGDFTGTSTSTAERGFNYVEGQGRVPLKLRSNRTVRGN